MKIFVPLWKAQLLRRGANNESGTCRWRFIRYHVSLRFLTLIPISGNLTSFFFFNFLTSFLSTFFFFFKFSKFEKGEEREYEIFRNWYGPTRFLIVYNFNTRREYFPLQLIQAYSIIQFVRSAIELMSAGKSDFGGYHLFNYASGLIFLLSDKIVGVDNFVFGGGRRRSWRSVCIRTRLLPGKVLN